MAASRSRQLRAVIYARVSKDPRQQGRSVDEQLTECRKVCRREGWRVVREFDDTASASIYAKRERKDYAALVAFIAAGHADVLVLWESSRKDRDQVQHATLCATMAGLGVKLSYNGRLLDLDDPDDRFLADIDNAVDARESGKTRKRVNRTIAAQAAAGGPHGPCPLGFVRHYDEKTKALVEQIPDPETAPLVRDLFKRALAGETPHALAVDLNDRGIPKVRGGQWDTTAVHRLLTNESYVGIRVHKPAKGPVQRTKAVWPALVDEDDFLTLRARLTAPGRRTNRGTDVVHLATGEVAQCGIEDCGGPLRVIVTGRSRGYEYVNYSCSLRSHLQRRQSFVDMIIVEHVVQRLSKPDVLRELNGRRTSDRKVKEARAEVLRIEARLEEAYASAAEVDGISPRALAAIETKLQPQLDAAQAVAAARTDVPGVVVALAGAEDVRARWEALDVVQRRLVVKTLFTVTLMPAGPGRRNDPSTVQVRRRRP